MRSEDSARTAWDRLRKQHADLLGNLSASINRLDDSSRGTFFRIHAGPVENASAERLCSELKRRNVGCIIVR